MWTLPLGGGDIKQINRSAANGQNSAPPSGLVARSSWPCGVCWCNGDLPPGMQGPSPFGNSNLRIFRFLPSGCPDTKVPSGLTQCHRGGWRYGGTGAPSALTQAALDQIDVLRGKRQRVFRHLQEVVCVPVSLHHAGLGVPRDSLEKVGNLVRHHVRQESEYLDG